MTRTYLVVSALIGIFWGIVAWFIVPDLAMLTTVVVFITAFSLLGFNYGTRAGHD